MHGKEGAISQITSVAPNPYECTSTAHGLSTGDYVILANASTLSTGYFVTVTGPNTFTLDGTTTGGTISGIPNARFNSGGGGSLSIHGGSLTLAQDPDNASRVKYILNAPGLDSGGEDFTFTNLKVEMYGSGSGCCLLDKSGAQPHYARSATFRDCNFGQTNPAGTHRNGVVVGRNQSVTFDNCVIPDEWNYVWNTTSSSTQTTPSLILMQNCLLLSDLCSSLKDRISFTGSWGRLIVRNCRGLDVLTSSRYAIDHDYNWQNAGRVDVPVQRTTAVLATSVEAFPRGTTNRRSIILPENAMLIAVHAYKPGVPGGPTDAYVLHIGNGDESLVYASSDNAAHLKRQSNGSAGAVTTQYKDVHELHVTDIWKNVGTDIDDRTVKMWATHTPGSTADQTGGYALVEYI